MAALHSAQFHCGYLDALEFTEMQSGDDCANCEFSHQLSEQSLADCKRFQTLAAESLTRAYARDYTPEQAGRDFWFTRNGHGVGFWDRPQLTGDLGDELTAFVADNFKGVDVYKGDDGLAYLA